MFRLVNSVRYRYLLDTIKTLRQETFTLRKTLLEYPSQRLKVRLYEKNIEKIMAMTCLHDQTEACRLIRETCKSLREKLDR